MHALARRSATWALSQKEVRRTTCGRGGKSGMGRSAWEGDLRSDHRVSGGWAETSWPPHQKTADWTSNKCPHHDGLGSETDRVYVSNTNMLSLD